MAENERLVTIKSWRAIATWHWKVDDTNCGICRNIFDGCCSSCKIPGDDCPIVWGKCNHAFHMHCIIRCLQVQNSCPMCRANWEYKD